MADVSKIKLPNQEVVNIKDSRITGIDATPTSGSTNVVTSGGAYAAIQDAIGDYVTLSTDQTITGSKTFYSANNIRFKADTNDIISTNSASAVSYSPLLWNTWHDHFAFLRSCSLQDVQYSTDGSEWSESSTNIKELFIHKDTTKITVLRTSDLAFRFTLYSYGAFYACGIEWLVLGVNYSNPFSAFDLKAEYSADNTTWTTWCEGNVTSPIITHFLRVGQLAGDQKYIRFTFTKTTNTTTGSVSLNIFSALTRRKGDQGQGREHSYPYQWDATPNVYPILNNTSYLGTSSYRWANVYSVLGNFSGALSVTGNTSIGGALGVTGDTVVNGTFQTLTTGGSFAKLLVYPSNPYGIVFKSDSSGKMTIQSQRESNDNETFPLLINPSGGNVGIGTSSPSEKLEVNGKIKSTSFIKSGGTSSQFLKADGSVDSNTYLTGVTKSLVTEALGGTPSSMWYAQDSPSGYYKIKINSGASWMLSFNINLYSYYSSTVIRVGGYNYNDTKTWYRPKATMVASTDTTSVQVTFGMDGDKDLWVCVPVSLYNGISITDVLYANTSSVINYGSDAFTITKVTDIPETVVATVTVYPPLNLNGGALVGNLTVGTSSENKATTLYGPLTVRGSATAARFVTSGGTASQFVKGDGSLDSNTYALASAIPTVDTTPTANSTNPVTSGGVYNALQTMSNTIAYIGDSQGSAQYIDEGGNVVDLSDYAKKTWVEAKNYLTAHQQLKTINNQSLVGEGNITISGGSGGGGDVNVIEAITFNGSAVPVTNKTAAITATIPAAVTESTVSGWGFTKNAGTLTGVTFNGTAATINNGVAAITATIPSVTTSTALNDGKLLTNGIDVNTKIRGAVFAASNAANADSSSPLGFNTSSSNPYIFLKQGGNTWYCQAYSGNFYFGPSYQSALCITPSGAGSVPSSFTAGSFVKSGGTSSQFLKADGSVDSTAYATAAALASNEQTLSGAINNLEDRIETLENSSSSGGITNVSFNGSVATVNSSGVAEIIYALPSKTSDLTNDSGFKKITISSSEPTSSDGSNGDIWFVI